MSPLVYQWNGEAMVVMPRFAKEADKRFVVGERYRLDEVQERSAASHNHQFAFVAEAWNNLPERYNNEPWAQSSEHLRKYALIRCQFCDTQTFPCGSNAEAMRWAARLRPIDEYSIVTVEGSVVFRFTAQSQSRRSMGATRFQESKSAIMEFLADLIGISARELT